MKFKLEFNLTIITHQGMMKVATILVIIAALKAILLPTLEARLYIVGEKHGWTVPQIFEFYEFWASQYLFYVGDEPSPGHHVLATSAQVRTYLSLWPLDCV